MTQYRVQDVTGWAARVLESTKVPAPDAAVAARLLVRSDLRGHGTHGLTRLPSYVERLTQGDFNPHPDIRFQRNAAAWLVEADGALGQVAGQRVLDQALPFLAREPMLWVSVRHIAHMGALGVLAVQAAEAGFICLLGQRTPPLLGLPGFRGPAIGHNPFAFASPAGDRPPLVFDMACSVAARGHILLAAREGKPIPEGWALDTQGQPTTDSAAAAAGALQPAGSHKGMGLAMMIECMAAALAATADSAAQATMAMPANGAMPRESAFFLFLNPSVLADARAYADYMEHWIAHYLDAGAGRSRIPGQRGHDKESAAAGQVSYAGAVETALRSLGERLGLPLPAPVESH